MMSVQPVVATQDGVVEALRFAISLLKNHGHALNEVCHEHEGEQGYCVGMAVILGAQAQGKSYEEARAARTCHMMPIWSDNGVPGYIHGYGAWKEARKWVAWAYGLPRDEDPSDWGEDAAITPNAYMKEHGIDPVPYIENAIALYKREPLPHPALPRLDCWAVCSEECGRPIRDVDGPCEVCGAALFGNHGQVE